MDTAKPIDSSIY